jgi:hypothetical protein
MIAPLHAPERRRRHVLAPAHNFAGMRQSNPRPRLAMATAGGCAVDYLSPSGVRGLGTAMTGEQTASVSCRSVLLLSNGDRRIARQAE